VALKTDSVENAGRCPRCKKFIVGEQLVSHKCEIAIKGAAAPMFFDWIGDGFTDDNDDYVRMATGLNGILYELVLCKHNPPHSAKRRFTDEGTKHELDNAHLLRIFQLTTEPNNLLRIRDAGQAAH
jgi:hypothetical protein